MSGTPPIMHTPAGARSLELSADVRAIYVWMGYYELMSSCGLRLKRFVMRWEFEGQK